MKNLLSISFVSLAALLSACGQPQKKEHGSSDINEAWNAANDPIRVSPRYIRNFASLPTSGQLGARQRPWSDTYWPNREGGIGARWMTRGADNPFTYRPPSDSEARRMSRDMLSRLSPAEKYDIFMGRFDYPTLQVERSIARPTAASWEGNCHGWAAAAMLYTEPAAVDVTGPSGITVPFGSSDVKALLTFFNGRVKANAGSRFLGARCNADLRESPASGGAPECRDTNAGAFHLVMANQLGALREGFILDVTRDFQVWNQPAYSFQTEVVGQQGPSPGAARGTVREVIVRSKLRYALEIYPRWQPVVGTSAQSENVMTYNYRLELDAGGNVIGGEWLQFDRPDFMWVPRLLPFDGYYAGLLRIYRPSY